MVIYFQFPFADLRKFTSLTIKKLSKPLWPEVEPNKDFIRSFGLVIPRTKKGIEGWINENFICIAKRAIRFQSIIPIPFINSYHSDLLKTELESRHFYSDGNVVCKLEIVFSTKPAYTQFPADTIIDFINHIMDLPIRIKIPYKKEKVIKNLHSIGNSIAELYFYSTTKKEDHKKIKENKLVRYSDYIYPCQPVIFIQYNPMEHIQILNYATQVDTNQKMDININHLWYRRDNRNARVWFMQVDESHKDIFNTRFLRMYLMRLHSEYEVLKKVFLAIEDEKILFNNDENITDDIQEYFNETTAHINELNNKSNKFGIDDNIGRIASSFYDDVTPGQLETTLKKIKSYRIRKQVYEKTENIFYVFENGAKMIKNEFTGDVNDGIVVQAGDGNIININKETRDFFNNVDMIKLSAELDELRKQLKEKAVEPEQDVVVGNIASASKAAKNGDKNKLLEYLKKAGTWALDTAKDIGVKVAVEAIKKAAGL